MEGLADMVAVEVADPPDVRETRLGLSDAKMPEGAVADNDTASEKPLRLVTLIVEELVEPGNNMLTEFGLADMPKSPVMSQTCNSELDWERTGLPQVPPAGYNLNCMFCPFVLIVTLDVSEVPEELPEAKLKPRVTGTPLKVNAWVPIVPPIVVVVAEDHVKLFVMLCPPAADIHQQSNVWLGFGGEFGLRYSEVAYPFQPYGWPFGCSAGSVTPAFLTP
jgi:hypothetical protein